MPHTLHFQHTRTFALQHPSDPGLIGATPDGHVFVEEIYGRDGWLAQGRYDPVGARVDSIDEDQGRQPDVKPLPLPDDLIRPARVWHTMRLNFAGPRHQGNRELERVDAVVQPLSIGEKIAVAQHLGLAVPPLLIGLAESYVLAETQIVPPGQFVVCRRLRYAYALDPAQVDASGIPIDYDSGVVYVVQSIDLDDDAEQPISDSLGHFGGVDLHRPMDCLLVGDRLYVADGGDPAADRLAQIHVWQVQGIPAALDDVERINKRLYE